MLKNFQLGPKLRWKVLNSIVGGLEEPAQKEVSHRSTVYTLKTI